ncbi:MAG: SDR family NAD(P)-dependent oxidoreductase [Bacteroidota bacterium]
MTNQTTWFITGASGEIGRHLTKRLLERGHRVAAASEDKESLRDQVRGVIGRVPGSAWQAQNLLCLTVDFTSEDSVRKAIQQTISQFGTIDVVVNYAGYALSAPVEMLTESEIHRHFEENVFGRFYVLKQAAPFLRNQRSGVILNFSSAAVEAAAAGSAIYEATKLAIGHLSEELTAGMEALGIKQTFIGPDASAQQCWKAFQLKSEDEPFIKTTWGGPCRQTPIQQRSYLA